jgi:hypothetical protein
MYSLLRKLRKKLEDFFLPKIVLNENVSNFLRACADRVQPSSNKNWQEPVTKGFTATVTVFRYFGVSMLSFGFDFSFVRFKGD